jgi:hypothetical protein
MKIQVELDFFFIKEHNFFVANLKDHYRLAQAIYFFIILYSLY